MTFCTGCADKSYWQELLDYYRQPAATAGLVIRPRVFTGDVSNRTDLVALDTEAASSAAASDSPQKKDFSNVKSLFLPTSGGRQGVLSIVEAWGNITGAA